MVQQLQKNQIALLLVILAVLIILTVLAVSYIGNESGLAISKAVEGGVSPIYGTFERSISPWGIDAERSIMMNYRF